MLFLRFLSHIAKVLLEPVDSATMLPTKQTSSQQPTMVPPKQTSSLDTRLYTQLFVILYLL
jgi:hypothetical protein